jgi:hypothetical protein
MLPVRLLHRKFRNNWTQIPDLPERRKSPAIPCKPKGGGSACHNNWKRVPNQIHPPSSEEFGRCPKGSRDGYPSKEHDNDKKKKKDKTKRFLQWYPERDLKLPEPLTAFIDMEFAGIYGTHQRMQIPIEIGVVLHNPSSDTISFAGKPFARDIEVELWKNVTNDIGKRVDGNRRVFNLIRPGESLAFDKKFHLDNEGVRHARTAITEVHGDIREFMQALNRKNIDTLVFFARKREVETFQRARVNMGGFTLRDLQSEIRHEYSLKEDVSLDRMSLVTGFSLEHGTISSTHFTYPIPEKFRYILKPHKAIGDAARMLLVSQEFRHHPAEFEAGVREHVRHYDARKIPPQDEATS